MSTLLNETNIGTPVTVTTTSETVAAATPVLFSASQNAIRVQGTLNFTVGTGTTTVTIRLRQGNGVGGTVIQTMTPINVTAGQTVDIPFDFLDSTFTLVGVAGGSYSVTIQQTGATANGTINSGDVVTEQLQ